MKTRLISWSLTAVLTFKSLTNCSAFVSRTFNLDKLPIVENQDRRQFRVRIQLLENKKLSRLFPLHAYEDDEIDNFVERPDPSVLLAAQSDFNQLVGLTFIGLSLLGGTQIFLKILDFTEKALPKGWFAAWRDHAWPVPMGLIFLAAGVSHFTMRETFIAMVPPRGIWGGLWQVPAPGAESLGLSFKEYHCYWTGLAEIAGGIALTAAGFGAFSTHYPALFLFFLTIAVTPANVYMATHDVQVPGLPPVPYPSGHIARGIMQCVLFAIFWKLAYPK